MHVAAIVRVASGVLLLVALAGCGDRRSETPAPFSAGRFEATTPCEPHALPIDGLPPDLACEMTAWTLDLNSDGTFSLEVSAGMSRPNTTELAEGAATTERSGTWHVTSPQGATPMLVLGDGNQAVRFAVISADLLHVTDATGTLRVGNGGWAYTINRSDPVASGAAPATETMHAPLLRGDYEGRTPCTEELQDFVGVAAGGQCERIKIALVLTPYPERADAGTYVLKGVRVGDGQRSDRRGEWSLGESGLLELSVPDGDPVRWHVPDDAHLYAVSAVGTPLVGTDYLSYTLSRQP